MVKSREHPFSLKAQPSWLLRRWSFLQAGYRLKTPGIFGRLNLSEKSFKFGLLIYRTLANIGASNEAINQKDNKVKHQLFSGRYENGQEVLVLDGTFDSYAEANDASLDGPRDGYYFTTIVSS